MTSTVHVSIIYRSSGKRTRGVRRNASRTHLKHYWKGSTLVWITGKPWLKNETSGGASLWMVLLHLSQTESRRRRIKYNFTSPESTITQPEASRQTLFVLNVTDCSMHELDSIVICALINLRYLPHHAHHHFDLRTKWSIDQPKPIDTIPGTALPRDYSPEKSLYNEICYPSNRSKQIQETHMAYSAGTHYTLILRNIGRFQRSPKFEQEIEKINIYTDHVRVD